MNFFAFSMLIPLFRLKIAVFFAFKNAVFIFILLRLLRSALVWFFILFAIILFALALFLIAWFLATFAFFSSFSCATSFLPTFIRREFAPSSSSSISLIFLFFSPIAFFISFDILKRFAFSLFLSTAFGALLIFFWSSARSFRNAALSSACFLLNFFFAITFSATVLNLFRINFPCSSFLSF